MLWNFSVFLSRLPCPGFRTSRCPSSSISSFCLPDGKSDVMHTRVQGGLFQLHCHHVLMQDAHELFHGSNWIFQCGRQIYLSHVSSRTFASKYRMRAAVATTLPSSPETHRPIKHPGSRHCMLLRQCIQPSVDSSKRKC